MNGGPKMSLSRKGISTRSQNSKDTDQNFAHTFAGPSKRKAESPETNKKMKRIALGNLTNASNKHEDNIAKIIKKTNTDTLDVEKIFNRENNSKVFFNLKNAKADFVQPLQTVISQKMITRAAVRNATQTVNIDTTVKNVSTIVKTKDKKNVAEKGKPTTRRISNEFERTSDSLYMSALEDALNINLSNSATNKRRISSCKCKLSGDTSFTEKSTLIEDTSIEKNNNCLKAEYIPKRVVPTDVLDFDKESNGDPSQVSEYAMDIFEYLKERECEFQICDYIDKQKNLSKWMRSLLVDWMAEVQESFELNHETLYLAVKIVDIYLGKTTVDKDSLQLLGAAAIFLSCKFDERTPPLVDDFLYICDGAYNRKQLLETERKVFKTIGYDLGIPLSYRFLRRYARCAKVSMPILTLARYILELSLMDYGTILFSDSKMASAALYIALQMSDLCGWTKTLEYYTGYKLEDFSNIVLLLNAGLHKKPNDSLNTIRSKYSHKLFYEVTKVKLIDSNRLIENKKPSIF